MRQAEIRAEIEHVAEQSYDQLAGEWREWLDIARRFEGKVPHQDRLDIRHNIILELALARLKSKEPIPTPRAYRIASFMIADYWRTQKRLTSGLDCQHCSKAQRQTCHDNDLYSECPKLVKLVSLDTVTVDAEGNAHTLKDTLADDKALDLDAWVDLKTWLIGCPTRLIEIATKRIDGKPLSVADRKYLWKYRKRAQIPLF